MKKKENENSKTRIGQLEMKLSQRLKMEVNNSLIFKDWDELIANLNGILEEDKQAIISDENELYWIKHTAYILQKLLESEFKDLMVMNTSLLSKTKQIQLIGQITGDIENKYKDQISELKDKIFQKDSIIQQLQNEKFEMTVTVEKLKSDRTTEQSQETISSPPNIKGLGNDFLNQIKKVDKKGEQSDTKSAKGH